MSHVLRTDASLVGNGGFNLPYPAGTRACSVTFARSPKPDWNELVTHAVRTWCAAHGVDWTSSEVTVEDLFITIGFTTAEVVVEVTDRMRASYFDRYRPRVVINDLSGYQALVFDDLADAWRAEVTRE